MKVHDFVERLNFSRHIDRDMEEFLNYLVEIIPGASDWRRATEDEDKSGVDYWILRDHGLPPLAIDVKHREFDPIERFGSDDICIETTSIYVGPDKPPWEDAYRKKVGWTLDATRRTDLIVYTWPLPNGRCGRRFWVVYFPFLCYVALKYWRYWAAKYGEKIVYNNEYKTLCIFVPRSEVEEAIRECCGGTFTPAQSENDLTLW
jgi:hypothetical protein